MIKKDKVDVLLERVEKLLDRLEQPTKVRDVVKAQVTKRGARHMDNGMYEAIDKLAVGEKVNITSYVRENKATFANVRNRISHYAWYKRSQGAKGYFRVYRAGTDVYVERIS